MSSIAQALAVVAVAWLYLRGRDEPRRLALAFVAAIAGFLAFTRFFSPQYLVWLVPFVVLLEPAVWVLVAAALVLAQVWFFHYSDVFALGGYVWLVLIRDLIVAALFVFALVKLGRRASEDEDPVLARTRAATPGFVVEQPVASRSESARSDLHSPVASRRLRPTSNPRGTGS